MTMWGLMLRLQGARVDASVPGWLMNAAATRVAITQVKGIAHELAAHPEQYDFDPTAVYTLFFQTWDRATTSLRSVAFGRSASGQSRVGLLPDPYYMDSRGYHLLRRAAGDAPRWNDRADEIAWRGSVTGDNTIARPEDLPRIRLAQLCRDLPDVDVGLIGVHSTMNNGREPGLLDAFLASHALTRDRWDMADFGRYKFTIDIDGHANAWGFLEKLILGCCVLKVQSPYEQWFYERLKPWQHYVPVRADLSDLEQVIAWCRTNPKHCEWIAHNGARVAALLTLEREVPHMCRTLLAAAHPRRANRSHPEATVPTPRFLLEEAAARAEDHGALDQAITAYSELIDGGDARPELLMRRHDFLRQRGDFAAAQADMEAAITAQPTNDEPPLRLAQFLALIGRHMAAVRLLERTLPLAPDRAEIAIAMAGSCLKLGWFDQAFWAVRALPENLPGWWADLRREVIDVYTSNRACAFTLLRERRRNGGLSPERQFDLALTLGKLGRTRAARWVSEALPSDFPSRLARIDLASAMIGRTEGPDAALRHLARERDGERLADQHPTRYAELLLELSDFQAILDEIGPERLRTGEAPLHAIVACSAVMLSRRTELIASCSSWMEQSPHDFTPAELLCGAQPLVDIAASNTPDAAARLAIGHFWSDKAIDSDVQATMDSWTDRHPHLQQHVFSADSARAFLLAHYGPETVRAFDVCDRPATQADYFRFAWLHRHGGLWVDVDQRCIRSVAGILSQVANSEMATVRSGHIKGYLQDSFLAARPGSTFMADALAAATDTILGSVARGEALWSWGAVGAGFLTRRAATAICRSERQNGLVLLAPMTYDSYARSVHTLGYKSIPSERTA